MRKSHILICVSVAIVLLIQCASTVQYVRFPDQSKAIEDSSKARIYVARPTIWGAAIPMNIRDGDFLIGYTGPAGYLCWERKPGETELKGEAENTWRLNLSLEEGCIYYVQQDVGFGLLMKSNRLREMSQEQGKKKVSRCKPPKDCDE